MYIYVDTRLPPMSRGMEYSRQDLMKSRVHTAAPRFFNYFRHVNGIIHRDFIRANIPAVKKPVSLSRTDGKKQ